MNLRSNVLSTSISLGSPDTEKLTRKYCFRQETISLEIMSNENQPRHATLNSLLRAFRDEFMTMAEFCMGARSGQNSVYYFCPLSNYFYGVQYLFIYMLELFLQLTNYLCVVELFVCVL